MILILILIAIVAVVVLAFVAAYALEGYFIGDILPIIGAIGLLGLLVYPFIVFIYIAAGTKAEIINREYGTSYTRQEIFFASDVIDTVRELKRQRIELNGDLMQKKD